MKTSKLSLICIPFQLLLLLSLNACAEIPNRNPGIVTASILDASSIRYKEIVTRLADQNLKTEAIQGIVDWRYLHESGSLVFIQWRDNQSDNGDCAIMQIQNGSARNMTTKSFCKFVSGPRFTKVDDAAHVEIPFIGNSGEGIPIRGKFILPFDTEKTHFCVPDQFADSEFVCPDNLWRVSQ